MSLNEHNNPYNNRANDTCNDMDDDMYENYDNGYDDFVDDHEHEAYDMYEVNQIEGDNPLFNITNNLSFIDKKDINNDAHRSGWAELMGEYRYSHNIKVLQVALSFRIFDPGKSGYNQRHIHTYIFFLSLYCILI
jgi:hypothetical protein